jgi:spermidine/putrescine transport system substrate-binding protein
MRTYNRRGVLAAGAAAAAAYYGARAGGVLAAAAGPKPSGTLHYYNWIDYVSPETYAAFTKATGITVRKSYFASNEALLARLEGGARGYDLAAPSGYMVARLVAEGLLERLDWKQLPTVRKNIDPKFAALPHDPQARWSVPKDWGTTGFVYRTDKIKERPRSWAQFFSLFERYPRKFTLLDASAEVVGSVAVMLGYSFNTDSGAELGRVEQFLLELKPYVHSFDSASYAAKIAKGTAYGGLAWNGDGAYVIARSPGNAAEYVVASEGGEFWVDAHVIPRGATNPAAAHAWIDFVYRPRISAMETLYTYFGSPLRRALFDGLLAPTVLRNRDLFPVPHTFAHLEASDLSARGIAERERIWKRVRGA